MNSLLRSKPKSNVKKVLGIILVVLGCFLALQFFFPRFFTSAVLFIAKPVWMFRDATINSSSGFFGLFSRTSTLRKENEMLRSEIYALRIREVEFNQMQTEYLDLKTLLGDSATSSAESFGMLARVLSKPPFTPYDSFVVDKGSDAGVSIGNLVYANPGLVIGRVTTVTSQVSFVTLFSSGGEAQEFLVSRTGVSLSVTGKGGGNFEIYVPKDFDIKVGDSLIEPSYDIGIVAQIYAVDETSQNSFKKVYARVPKAIFQSKSVLIGI
jgi:cell shape-determining protein MreC